MELVFPRAVRLLSLSVSSLTLFSALSLAQTSSPPAEKRATNFEAVAISPDASTLAWTLREETPTGIHLRALHGQNSGEERTITVPGSASDCAYGSPVWAPDGQTLAFTSSCAVAEGAKHSGQEEIFLWSKATGQTHQLTHLVGNLEQPAWSPNGKSIAFLFVENATRSAGALDAMKPFSGVIGEDGVEVQRVYSVSAMSGQGAFITAPNLHVYEFDWAPDANGIAFIAANPPGENNWWVAKLYVSTLGTVVCGDCLASQKNCTPSCSSPAVRVVLDPGTVAGSLHGLQIAVPRFSPDGKQIAVIGGLMSDQGSTGGDLYTVDTAGGSPVDLTPGIDGTPTYESWISDHTVAFVEDRSGRTLLSAVNVNSKAVVPGAPVDLGEVAIGAGPIKDAIAISDRLGKSKDRVVAFSMQSFTHPPEIYTQTAEAGPVQITHVNEGLTPSSHTQSVEWSSGPFHVQGWLTLPANYDPAKKYPLIVQVHGGPSASIPAHWISGGGGAPDWAQLGYFEFQPNPRGSFGQGEAFTEANRKDFGYGDLRDILAGLDMIEARYSVDKNREGITGWSYGGFMTMFAVTQTHRFRAAVAGAGLSDWLSYYGENSIDQWMIPFFGASVYDDPAVYAKSSPITFIKNVKTPTLVIVGDRDGECPAPQSFEFWHALRDLGVKTQLVVYPDEGHGFRNPQHIADRSRRVIEWFAQNMPATPASAQTAQTWADTTARQAAGQ